MHDIFLRSSSIPFKVSRELMMHSLDETERTHLNLALRPIFHTSAKNEGSLSDRQRPDEQLRFYTKDRCLRDFRSVAQYFRSQQKSIQLTLDTLPNQADLDFFGVLSDYNVIAVHIEDASGHIEDRHCDVDGLRLFQGQISEMEWKAINNRLVQLLNHGDSWTAVWLCEHILRTQSKIPNFIYDAMGLSYGLQNRTVEAERFFEFWGRTGGINSARANYSRAMLYARHHPLAMRNQETAKALLSDAWEILSNLETTEDVTYERMFNRNGYALILYRERQYDQAAALLEGCTQCIDKTRFQHSVHHTVLLNNLGRIYAAMNRSEDAERVLRACVSLDPDFAEYWFDLATFYSDVGRLADAVEAAQEAERCSTSIADVPALLGYLDSLVGLQEHAAKNYIRAWDIEPRPEFALEAARAWSEIDDYVQVQHWLDRATQSGLLTLEQQETFDVLRLETELQDAGNDLERLVRERLTVLATKYPHSEVIRENTLRFGI